MVGCDFHMNVWKLLALFLQVPVTWLVSAAANCWHDTGAVADQHPKQDVGLCEAPRRQSDG